MTNIYKEPTKLPVKQRLFEIGLKTLEKEGYAVSRIRGAGPSVRRVTKGNKSLTATIRTSQSQWFAFPRTADDKGWLSLDDADLVVVVTIDETREKALTYIFPGGIVRERFDKLYKARLDAGHSIPLRRGVWLSLFSRDKTEANDHAPIYVGAGLGYEDKYKRDVVPLGFKAAPADTTADEVEDDEEGEIKSSSPNAPAASTDEGPLTIAEAKRRLALTFGVDPSAIKITVEG